MRKKTLPAEHWLLCLESTPIGPLYLVFTLQGLAGIYFAEEGAKAGLTAACGQPPEAVPPAVRDWMTTVRQELEYYFAGRPADFHHLALDPAGTAFQRQVWQALQEIPRGATLSYGELARRLGRPQAARGVGQAVGANPLPVIIPCHRVLAAGGKLGGYGGGLDRKRWLLQHEGAM